MASINRYSSKTTQNGTWDILGEMLYARSSHLRGLEQRLRHGDYVTQRGSSIRKEEQPSVLKRRPDVNVQPGWQVDSRATAYTPYLKKPSSRTGRPHNCHTIWAHT